MKEKKGLLGLLEKIEGDKVVWIIALMLILISIVCIFSSTSRLLDGSQTRIDIVKSQLVIVCLGLAVIVGFYNIKSLKVLKFGSALGFPISFILLTLLLSKINLPFLKSIELNGARRILQLGGIQIHVFEVVKVAMVLYLAWAQDAFKRKKLKGPRSETGLKWMYLYAPFLITFLMVIPGSNSAALFIGGIMFFTILLGGGNLKDMTMLAGAGILLVALCFGIFKLSDGKAMKRMGTAVGRIFEDEDWERKVLESRTGSVDYYEALDEIRQPYSAKIAIKEGGLLGKGPGQSTQRYVVPDMSEDYMFSFILEEYGLWGALVVIILYVSLLARGAIIVRNCGNELYAKLAVAGLSLLITGQAFLHMFVNADIGPMTGQTLPLISHGNSAFLCFSLAFGVILSISRIASRKIAIEQKNADSLSGIDESMIELEALESMEDNQ